MSQFESVKHKHLPKDETAGDKEKRPAKSRVVESLG